MQSSQRMLIQALLRQVPYVPNLVSNVNNVQVLFYDNATGQWQLIPAVKVDPVTKTVAVNVPGSGTLSVVYK